MTNDSLRPVILTRGLGVLTAGLFAAGCASSSSPGGSAPLPVANPTASAPTPDARVGLRGGWFDAATAMWNLEMVSTTPPSKEFMNPANPADSRLKSSDLAFIGNTVYQGNYGGWQAWDISNVRKPAVIQSYVCPGSQSDVSVYRNLLFVSHEANTGRIDCGLQGVPSPVSKDRARGVRIFDISDVRNPKRVAVVQTCRGSHTHTLVTDPNDKQNVYIYVSGSSGVRSAEELPGCVGGLMSENPNTADFRLEVIQIPLANPEQAKIITSPRVFNNLTAPPRRTEPGAGGGRAGRAGGGGAAAGGDSTAAAGRGGRGGGRGDVGPRGCHDITVYPAIGLAGGACGGYGFLLDIRDVKNPKRITEVADSNMSFWHSATFSNDGKKILFSDEWGGGTAPRCRSTDKMEWGADAIFTLENNVMTFKSYYKMPAAQTALENCVAHNGSLIPIPGRDVMVQSWYQGGISIFDFTDAARPKEIAYFDRGPLDTTKLVAAGHWSAYWYNGHVIASEEFRGLDIFELKPSAFISQNEIDAAKSVRMEWFNPQEQPKIVWPPSFAVARSYLDQLARGNGIARDRATAIASDLAAAEKLSGARRRDALNQLATRLDGDAPSAMDGAKVRMMASAVRELASAQR
jgi:hypothetical protein